MYELDMGTLLLICRMLSFSNTQRHRCFARSRLAKVVVGEHLILLLGGLGIGLFAALLAVLPHGWTGGASPPWSTLVGVLGTILLVGLGTGGLAVNRVMTQPTLEALRDE